MASLKIEHTHVASYGAYSEEVYPVLPVCLLICARPHETDLVSSSSPLTFLFKGGRVQPSHLRGRDAVTLLQGGVDRVPRPRRQHRSRVRQHPHSQQKHEADCGTAQHTLCRKRREPGMRLPTLNRGLPSLHCPPRLHQIPGWAITIRGGLMGEMGNSQGYK